MWTSCWGGCCAPSATRHGEYSEVYIHTPSGGAVGRLIVDKFTAKVYSTQAEEVHAVNQLVAQRPHAGERGRDIGTARGGRAWLIIPDGCLGL